MALILVIVLILLLFGSLPNWPHSQSWGWGPSGLIGVLLIVLLLLYLTGNLHGVRI